MIVKKRWESHHSKSSTIDQTLVYLYIQNCPSKDHCFVLITPFFSLVYIYIYTHTHASAQICFHLHVLVNSLKVLP